MRTTSRPTSPALVRAAGGLLAVVGAGLAVLAAVAALERSVTPLGADTAIILGVAGLATVALGVAVWRGVPFAAPVALVVVGILLLSQLTVFTDPDRGPEDVWRLALLAVLVVLLALAAVRPRGRRSG